LGKFECQTPELTAFGKLHYYPFDDLPILCGEVKARKAGGHDI
jgi:hypothetical protein